MFYLRALALLSIAAGAVGACGGPTRGAALLKASVESIGDEMMALHEPKRDVEYHDRSGQPFWVAFIPPQADAASLAAAGITLTALGPCRQPGRAMVAVGEADGTDCATVPHLTVPALRVLRKGASETVRMTLSLDAKGYRLVYVR